MSVSQNLMMALLSLDSYNRGRLIPLTQVTPTDGIADDLRAAGGE